MLVRQMGQPVIVITCDLVPTFVYKPWVQPVVSDTCYAMYHGVGAPWFFEYTVVWTHHHEYGVLHGYGVTGHGYGVSDLTHGVTCADPYH